MACEHENLNWLECPHHGVDVARVCDDCDEIVEEIGPCRSCRPRVA